MMAAGASDLQAVRSSASNLFNFLLIFTKNFFCSSGKFSGEYRQLPLLVKIGCYSVSVDDALEAPNQPLELIQCHSQTVAPEG
jgi:hypothetical protein